MAESTFDRFFDQWAKLRKPTPAPFNPRGTSGMIAAAKYNEKCGRDRAYTRDNSRVVFWSVGVTLGLVLGAIVVARLYELGIFGAN